MVIKWSTPKLIYVDPGFPDLMDQEGYLDQSQHFAYYHSFFGSHCRDREWQSHNKSGTLAMIPTDATKGIDSQLCTQILNQQLHTITRRKAVVSFTNGSPNIAFNHVGVISNREGIAKLLRRYRYIIGSSSYVHKLYLWNSLICNPCAVLLFYNIKSY